jgi:hypothetical protein
MCIYYCVTKFFVEVLKIIPMVIIGGITAYIAYQQLLIQKNKLRHDLFDRRYKVLSAVLDYVATVKRTERNAREDLAFDYVDIHPAIKKLFAIYIEAHFLFGPEIVEYINTMIQKAKEVFPPDKATLADENIKWFSEQLEGGIILKKFRDYMSLKGIHG